MAEWLGVGHLFELSREEAILGFLTPLIVFVAFFVAQLVLPARWVPGYVVDSATGEPRRYRLNGLLVFVVALAVWAFELTGMPRDWFYRSSVYAVAGGTVLTTLLTIVSVFSQPAGKVRNPLLALWFGRAQEQQLFNGRFDVKMYFYVVGGAMWALNALSAAAYHHDLFGANANPGVYLYAAFVTFYIFDYFIFERVQLYTYDLIHEGVGFKLWWGGLMVYGWMFILPLWGLAVYPGPGFSPAWTNAWLAGSVALFVVGWGTSRAANMQKYTFKRWPDRKFLGLIEPKYIEAGDRKILCSGFWGAARHLNYMGEGLLALSVALVFGHPANLWSWTYFIFIVSFFLYRQLDDDKHCAAKYGPERWAEYRQRVRWRMMPGVY